MASINKSYTVLLILLGLDTLTTSGTMGVEILGADMTPKQVEANEGKGNFPSEMDGKSFSNLGQELNEPTKTGATDTLNGTNGKAKEGDNMDSSNIPKDAADEWPAPKQIHTFYFIRICSYENPQLKTEIAKAETDLRKKIDTRSEIIDQLKEKRVRLSFRFFILLVIIFS